MEIGPSAQADIEHLLRRTEFSAKPSRVAELVPLTLEQAVDDVLDIARNGNPQIPAAFRVYTPERNDLNYQTYVSNVYWWVDQMATAPRPIQEKMTVFWHGYHFVTGLGRVVRIDRMCTQTQLYRDRALGNLRTLAHEMAVQPAMLVYLDNASNNRSSPNENFARELLELFTLGTGNYTQDDVAAAARAWTGHNLDTTTDSYRFYPDRHDTGNKTFFGTTKNWDGPGIIDEILRDNPAKKLAAAKFVARKLWTYFAYPNPDQRIVDDLAAVFVAADLEVKPLLRALLLRPEFYSATARQGLVRSPVELCAAACRMTGLPAVKTRFAWAGTPMNQYLFDPPNVAGWKNNGYWLATSALSARADLAWALGHALRENDGYAWLSTLPVDAAIDRAAALFGVNLTAASRAALATAQVAMRAISIGAAVTVLLVMVALLPEFHMA